MKAPWTRTLILAAISSSGLALPSCSSGPRSPSVRMGHMDIEASISRSDLELLNSVEGQSSTLSILFGMVQIVDGSKLKLFWIPFFRERYAPVEPPSGLLDGVGQIIGRVTFGKTRERAHAYALEETPDADAVFEKGSVCEFTGVPFICCLEEATYRGKALKLRPDPVRVRREQDPPKATKGEQKKSSRSGE